MLKYNTSQAPIKLPEYGRNVEQLVKYCKTIPDRTTRTRFAYQIVSIMADINPNIAATENKEKILWDQLAMMADFELDIDYPTEVISHDKLSEKPHRLPYKSERISLRLYGKVIEDMLHAATLLPEREQRIRLFEQCANQMKLTYYKINKDAEEDDNKIIQDVVRYAGEEFREEIYQVFLYTVKELLVNDQYNEAALTTSKKKKKKKK